MSKTKLGILFGGQSPEHEISFISARTVLLSLDASAYEFFLIYIDRDGRWHLLSDTQQVARAETFDQFASQMKGQQVVIVQGEREHPFLIISTQEYFNVDVIFPVLHGPNGEDGTVQGLLQLSQVPFVGSGVMGSAAGMDKVIAKQLFNAADIPTPVWFSLRRADRDQISFQDLITQLGLPFFVKPANLGSSIGMTRVKSAAEFEAALDLAFQYDQKIIFEQAIHGRELEVSVLGNDDIRVSLPGEVITHENFDFYTYEAKYLAEEGAKLVYPVELSPVLLTELQTLAQRAYIALNCQGLARVDFFLTAFNELLVNEVNTLPGLTPNSLYPKLWEVSGMSYDRLFEELIHLAQEQGHRADQIARAREAIAT